MPVRMPSRSMMRLWALLFVALLVVGLSAGIATLRLALNQYTTDLRTELLNTARLIAMTVDSDDLSGLRNRVDMRTPRYRALSDRLAQAQREATDIRDVHTFRQTPSGSFEFVLDPTTPGDHDGDGVDDKRYLLDPYPEISPFAKKSYETATPLVEPSFISDRFGKFWTAYAPLVDKAGHVVGVLAVDRDASSIEGHIGALHRVGYVGLGLVIGLSFLFSLILARQLDRRFHAREPGSPFHSTRTMRGAVLELILAGLSFSVLLIGVVSFVGTQGIRGQRDIALGRGAEIDALDRGMARLAFQRVPGKSELNALRASADRLNLGWLLGMLDKVQLNKPGWRQDLQGISAQLGLERERLDRTTRNLDSDLRTEEAVFEVAFFLGITLGLASLGLLRAAVRHHQELVCAQDESEAVRAAYKQIADHLPIGLFMVRRGDIVFSNAAWDAQLMREPTETRCAALTRSLHPEDVDAINGSLLQSSGVPDTIDIRYRIIRGADETRMMQAHAVPVLNSDREIDHLLGFAVDVTSQVDAERNLQAKQKESEAKNVMLETALSDLEENFQEMVHALVKAVEAKDPYTAGHSERVTEYSVRIGEALHLSTQELTIVRLGTLIHDVGKIGIPDDILLKPDKLTDAERDIIKAHPSIGAAMVERIPLFRPCLPIIRWHHERLNGQGYPDGLVGAEIPRIVRIAMVADAFDAMTSSRAYRAALGPERAIEELRDEATRGGLDLEVVEALAEIVLREGILWKPADQAA